MTVRPDSRPESGWCWLWAGGAAALVLLWWVLVVHFVYADNWTGLFCTGERMPIPPDFAASTYRFKNSYGYDGQEYRYIAHDPFFRKGYAAYLDDPRLRYRRILLPGAAYLLALGSDNRIDAAYIVCDLLAVFFGVYWCSRYMRRHSRSPAWGCLFVAVPATLGSIDRMLTDGLLAAVFAAFMLYSASGNPGRVYTVSALAAMTRETGIFLVASAVAYRLVRGRYRDAALFATAAIPAAAWYVYVAGNTQPSQAYAILDWPTAGLVRRLFTLQHYPELQALRQLFDAIALAGFIGSLLAATYLVWTESVLSETSLAVLVFAALALVLGNPVHMTDTYGYARPVSPLLLYVMLRSVARGSIVGTAPPLLTSMNVAIYVFGPALRVLQGLRR